MSAKRTRSIEREIFIDAEPERVWEAFTEAQEIVNWFALKSESKPGVGGYIGLSWDMKSIEPGRCHIVEWDPARHLLMTWRDAPGGENELPIDVRLSAKDGGTLLRLVHSGFLSDASWDEEYDAHGRGWSYELRSLKFYLERHIGKTRQYVMQKFPVASNTAEAWAEVVGNAGAFVPSIDALKEGAEFALGLPNGSTTAGELLFSTENRDFVASAAVLQGGLFRIAMEMMSGVPEVWIWAFSWQLSEEELRVLMEPMFEAVRKRISG